MGNLIKIFNGKRYKYYASRSSKTETIRWAKQLRKREGVLARVVKDERKYASTYHIFIRGRNASKVFNKPKFFMRKRRK